MYYFWHIWRIRIECILVFGSFLKLTGYDQPSNGKYVENVCKFRTKPQMASNPTYLPIAFALKMSNIQFRFQFNEKLSKIYGKMCLITKSIVASVGCVWWMSVVATVFVSYLIPNTICTIQIRNKKRQQQIWLRFPYSRISNVRNWEWFGDIFSVCVSSLLYPFSMPNFK